MILAFIQALYIASGLSIIFPFILSTLYSRISYILNGLSKRPENLVNWVPKYVSLYIDGMLGHAGN